MATTANLLMFWNFLLMKNVHFGVNGNSGGKDWSICKTLTMSMYKKVTVKLIPLNVKVALASHTV